MTLSIVIITYNEEANLPRTLESVLPLIRDGQGEIVVVDSGSTDRTVEIAQSLGARVFIEDWKGYAGQKNSAIEKATGDWILSLDADEVVDSELSQEIEHQVLGKTALQDSRQVPNSNTAVLASSINGVWIRRKNYFLGRWIRHGGFWPDPKLRLFRGGTGKFENRTVHETAMVDGKLVNRDGALFKGALLHYSYPTLSDYIDHMNRYSTLGAEMAIAKGRHGFSLVNIVSRPLATFAYNYVFRLGFLDGREGLLLHLYHAVYVSWKYAKGWELGRARLTE